MAEPSPAPTPSRAVYGFAFHLITLLLLAAYFAWAIVPDATLRPWEGDQMERGRVDKKADGNDFRLI